MEDTDRKTAIMDNYHYSTIDNVLEENYRKEKTWIYFLRQFFICSGSWCLMFMTGLGFGAPTVYIAQLRKENTDDAISEEMCSWLMSIAVYSAPIWAIIWTILTKYIGRKIPLALASTTLTIGFIVFYYSTHLTHLLISEVFKGAAYACNMTLVIFVVTEYCSPKYRGLFLTIKAATVFWGMWVSNTIGTFFHWKCIGIPAFVCYVYTLTIFFWPESPLWLATKGKFDDCAATHRWLKGTSGTSEHELKILLETQKEKYQNRLLKKTPRKQYFSNFFRVVKRPEFYKPMTIAFLVGMLYITSGKIACAFYALQIMKKVMNDEGSAYTVMLILDGVTVFGMYCGCLIARYVRRRTLLLTCSCIGITFLYLLSLYFYLIYLNIVTQNAVLTIALLTLFSIGIAMGPMILSYSLYGELIPTDARTTYSVVGVVIHFFLFACYLRVSPYIFNGLSLHYTFLTYAVSATIMTGLLFVYLPETKDKTLTEIQNYFKAQTTEYK